MPRSADVPRVDYITHLREFGPDCRVRPLRTGSIGPGDVVLRIRSVSALQAIEKARATRADPSEWYLVTNVRVADAKETRYGRALIARAEEIEDAA